MRVDIKVRINDLCGSSLGEIAFNNVLKAVRSSNEKKILEDSALSIIRDVEPSLFEDGILDDSWWLTVFCNESDSLQLVTINNKNYVKEI